MLKSITFFFRMLFAWRRNTGRQWRFLVRRRRRPYPLLCCARAPSWRRRRSLEKVSRLLPSQLKKQQTEGNGQRGSMVSNGIFYTFLLIYSIQIYDIFKPFYAEKIMLCIIPSSYLRIATICNNIHFYPTFKAFSSPSCNIAP